VRTPFRGRATGGEKASSPVGLKEKGFTLKGTASQPARGQVLLHGNNMIQGEGKGQKNCETAREQKARQGKGGKKGNISFKNNPRSQGEGRVNAQSPRGEDREMTSVVPTSMIERKFFFNLQRRQNVLCAGGG